MAWHRASLETCSPWPELEPSCWARRPVLGPRVCRAEYASDSDGWGPLPSTSETLPTPPLSSGKSWHKAPRLVPAGGTCSFLWGAWNQAVPTESVALGPAASLGTHPLPGRGTHPVCPAQPGSPGHPACTSLLGPPAVPPWAQEVWVGALLSASVAFSLCGWLGCRALGSVLSESSYGGTLLRPAQGPCCRGGP